MVQSNAILETLAESSGRWGAANAQQWQNCREWLFWEANKIGLCLPQIRAHHRFDNMRLSDGALAWLMNRYRHDVDLLEQTLSDGRRYMLGDEVSIADCSLCGYLFYADEAQVEVPAAVNQWLSRLSELPGWQPPSKLLA